MHKIDVDAIVAGLRFSSVTLGNTRPVLLKSVIDAGMLALRPGSQDATNLILSTIVNDIAKLFNLSKDDEVDTLSKKIDELEKQATESIPKLTTSEVMHIRVIHEYGMTVKQISKLYEVNLDVIAAIVGKSTVYYHKRKKKLAKNHTT